LAIPCFAVKFIDCDAMKRTIVITGPESSGKSQLSQSLAHQFNSPWVAEYARWYLEHLYREYKASDLLAISLGQQNAYYQSRSLFPNKPILIDTWAIVLMVWSTIKYGAHPKVFESWLLREPIDVFLLCAPDLPWEDDPLREHPEKRWELFEMYQNILDQYQLPYQIVEGTGDERLQRAVEHLNGAGIQ
jgi:NadR type nicotinamide-nucleotide adenylyltransferase